MGCFDWIEDELYCPYCGTKSKDFQTKDLGCLMKQWSIKDIKECGEYNETYTIYEVCRKCEEWIEIVIKGEHKDE